MQRERGEKRVPLPSDMNKEGKGGTDVDGRGKEIWEIP